METSLGSGIGAGVLLLLAALGVVVFGVWAVSLAWVWRDAERRGQPGFIVAVLVGLLFWPVSLIVWLLARPGLAAAGPTPAAGRKMGLVVGLLVVLALGGALSWSLLRKPVLTYWTSTPGKHGYLSVLSDPPGATVTVRIKPAVEPLRFADGPYRVNAAFDGTEPRVIGMTPVERYQLPAVNRLNVKYTYGVLRGSKIKSTEVDCVYEIEVSKELYQTKVFDNVLLTDGNTTSLQAELTKKQATPLPSPKRNGGVR